MIGKRTYCILGTMLLAFASLGAGVSAEQNDEQATNLEELGVLEISIDEHGVVEAVITQDALLSFMNSDDEAILAIESIDATVDLDDDGNILLSDVDLGIGEEQRDEVAVTLRLSEELVEILQDEDMHHLLVDLGFGDDLGLDDFDPEVEDWEESLTRVDWADAAYQVRGNQSDYERVMDSEDPEGEFYHILEEFEENYDSFVDETFGARLHWADEAYQIRGSQEDYDRVMDAEDPAEEFYTIYDEVMQEWDESEDVEENETDLDDEEHWEEESDIEPEADNYCERGLLRGAFTIDDDGNGTMRGLVMNDEGDVIGNMWGEFNTDGFAYGLAGADNLTDAQWKAVYEDGRFTGLWKMIDENDSMHGLLKGHYEVNETEDGGVFHGKWKEVDCRDAREDWDLPERDDVRPRHAPLQVDSDRVDVRPLDKAPKQKPMMDKLGDVMDKPIIEDEDGGAIVDIGEAAAGSTLGTIALLGAGFLRRRVTGGL